MMMDEDHDFSSVLKVLMVKSRDPRAVRLAAVTSAMLDVVGDDQTPANVYASIVQTLKEGNSLDLATQLALMELLAVTLPHVAAPTLSATLPVTSRTLRSIVSACREAGTVEKDETKDELGGINAALRASCRVVSVLIQHILSTSADEQQVRKLLQGTLLILWDDRRPKVRKAAQQAASEALQTGNTVVSKTMSDFCASQLSRNNPVIVIHTVQWLQHAILYLNKEKLSTQIMEMLMNILQPSSDDAETSFVAKFKQGAQQRAMVAHALLSLLVTMMEEQERNEDWINQFSARVLASLLQSKPSLVLSGTEQEDATKILYGQAVLTSCQRVLTNVDVGRKLLPLAVQMVVQMSKPTTADDSVVIAEGVLPELTKLIRTNLMNSSEYNVCFPELLQSLEVVLQSVYRPTWSVSLMPLALMLQLQAEQSESGEIVSLLLRRHTEESSSGAGHQQAIEDAVGSLIQGVGLEHFWQWIVWNDTKKVKHIISPHKAWLLPLLKTSAMAASTSSPSLDFFQNSILSLARQCDAAGDRQRVMDLWSLFGCFCVQPPPDFATVFPDLVQILVRAMGDARYPQLVPIICNALRTLAQTILGSSDEETLSQVSTKLLPALFKLVETLQGTLPSKKQKNDGDNDDEMDVEEKGAEVPEKVSNLDGVQSVTAAIAELSRAAPVSYVQTLLKKVIQRLLTATQSEENESEKICTLLGLSQALVASQALNDDAIGLLYRAVKPFIRSDEHPPRVQKRAYKVLLEICQKKSEFATDPERLAELIDLLVGSIMTCQVSARHLRLKCLTVVVNSFVKSNKQQMDTIPKITGEVLLCLKDSNGKTREAGYQLLIAMAKVMDDMPTFFKIIAGALGAQTPHMRSAAVMAMSRLVFEFARIDMTVEAMLPMMLQTVCVLFDENSREVIKSAVGFVRVCIAAVSAEQLEPLLPEVVGGLFKYHKGKDRFRAKIKIIIKILVRNFGYAKLMPLVPAGDSRLLTHMRKLDERTARRRAAQREDGKSRSNAFEDLMESDEEDSDDGRTIMSGATKFTEMTGRTGKSVRTAAIGRQEQKSIRSNAASTVATSRSKVADSGPRLANDRDGDVLDMLGPGMSKSVRFAVDEDSDDDSDGGVMEFDDLGRLVVPDDMEDSSRTRAAPDDDDDDDEQLEIKGMKRRKLSSFEIAKNARDEAQQKRNQKKKGGQALGAAYKSKKAGGDVKKKGQKFEPYAFVPLDGKSYTKKNRRKAVDSMSSVVRGGKRKR